MGIAAGFVLALYAPAIFVDATLQKSVIDVFLLAGLLWLLSRTLDAAPPARHWIGIGALLGALCLTRENALILVAALGVWLWLERRERRDWLRQAALAAAGVALVLAPVALRNGVVGGEWHLTTSQFGPNFYIGNNAEADGAYRPLRYGRGDAAFERDDATALAEAAAGRDLTPAAVSRYWVGRALDDIAAAPARWLGLLVRKAALTFNAVETIDTESQYAHEEHSLPLAATGWLTHFGLLLPLAAVGIAVTWPQRRRLLPLYLMLGLYAASVIAFYVFARYRYPLAPFLVLFAAAGGDHLVRVARRTATLAHAPAVAAGGPRVHRRRQLAVAVEGPHARRVVQQPGHRVPRARGPAAGHRALRDRPDPRRELRAGAQQPRQRAGRRRRDGTRHRPLPAGHRDRSGHRRPALQLRQRPAGREPLRRSGRAVPLRGGSVAGGRRGAQQPRHRPRLGGPHGGGGGAFREAVRLDPAGARAHRNLGIALEELGDALEAQRHYAEAQRLEAAAPDAP